MKTLRTLLPILAVLILLGGGDYLYRQRFQEYGQGEEEDEGDQGSSLLKQCIEKGNYFVEVGNPNAPTKVEVSGIGAIRAMVAGRTSP